jgi:hypothetical protein
MSVQAYSLSDEAVAYIKGVTKGQRSKVVNRAILFYKDNGSIMDARDQLQALVLEYGAELDILRAKNSENDAKTPPWGHRFMAFIRRCLGRSP